MAVTCVACMEHLAAHHKFHVHTMNFRCSSCKGAMKIEIVEETVPLGRSLEVNQEDIFVKFVVMISAEGFVSRTVLVIEDDAVPKDRLIILHVPGLSSGALTEDYGWIVFRHPRSGCSAFWEFYMEHVCLGEIQEMTAFMTEIDAGSNNLTDQRSCLILNADLEVFRAVMNDRIRPLFHAQHIDVVSLEAAINAPGSVLLSTMISIINKTAAHVSSEFIAVQMSSVYRILQSVHSIELSSLKRDQITQTATAIAYCLNAGGYTKDHIQQFFTRSDQYVYRGPQESSQPTIDMERIIRASGAEISDTEMKCMISNIDHFCDVFLTNRKIIEAEINERLPAAYQRRDARHMLEVLLTHGDAGRFLANHTLVNEEEGPADDAMEVVG
jgi:hypothetical protein